MDFRGSKIDLVGKLNLWFGISAVLLAIGMIGWAAFGLNLGIDFQGGGQLQYRIPESQRLARGQEVVFMDSLRDALQEKGIENPKLQIAGGDTLVVQTRARDDSELRGQERVIGEVVASQWKVDQSTLQPLSRELVGPVIGKELRQNAIKGVILGVLAIAGWIFIRYNFAGGGLRYAAGGIAALLHDVLILLGIFAILGRIDNRIEIDGSFIAALLTVVGYSINDSVVIFDRVRENLRQRRKESFNSVVNASLLETMSRSINTGITVLIMLFMLLLFGGESIYNFVLAMLIGIACGLYSSIFNASMVLVAWNNWDEKKAARERETRAGARSGRTVTTRDTTARSTLAASGAGVGSSSSGLAARSAGSRVEKPTSEIAPPSTQPTLTTSGSSDGTAPLLTETPAENAPVEIGNESTTRAAAPKPTRKARSKRRY